MVWPIRSFVTINLKVHSQGGQGDSSTQDIEKSEEQD